MPLHAVALWDVLMVSSWLAMQLVLGVRYTWPVIVVSACVCMRDRDLEAHECIIALYMLRHTCGAIHAPTIWLAIPAAVLGCWSRFNSYRVMDPLQRRVYVLVASAICLLLLHRTSDASWTSCTRVVLYVATTRHAVLNQADPWDAVAQSIWLLCVPSYSMVLVAAQLNDALGLYPVRKLKPTSSVWTAEV